jgi:hypothetical protein
MVKPIQMMSDSDMNTIGGGQMVEARMSNDLARSSRPKGGNATGGAKNLFHSLSEIGATLIKYFWWPHSASNWRERVPVQAPPVATAVEDAVVKASVTKTFPPPVTADVIIDPDTHETQTNRVARIVPDDQEVQRRRDLVRGLFNDFWSGSYDKPAAFADRLAQAEPYINERLTACGEFWRLDAETRITLGLPPTKNSAKPR